MQNNRRGYKTLCRLGWLVMAVLGAAALAKGFAEESAVERLTPGEVTVLNDRWSVQSPAEAGYVDYAFAIPEETGGALLLSMKTYLPKFQLLLDETPIYTFSDLYGVKGRSQHMIRLPQDAQGKTLVLRVQDTDEYSAGTAQLGNACLGEKDEVLVKLLWDNLYALAFAIFALLLGGGMLAAAVSLKKSLSSDILRCQLYFGVFILVAGVWVVTDSELLLFVTDRVAVVSLISFVSFMVMPAFLLRFFHYLLGKQRGLDILSVLFFMLAAAYLVNYIVQAVPGYVLLAPTHMACIGAIFIVVSEGLKKLKDTRDRVMRQVMEGFALLSGFAVGALALFYINPVSQYSGLYCLGISAFILRLMGAVFRRLYEQLAEQADVEAYRRLAYMDIMTGMENRTAFMAEQQRDDAAGTRALIMLDINNLKLINDKEGHQEGDLLIIAAAVCIKDVFGQRGKCYRIGGDEFVVLLECGRETEITVALEQLEKRIQAENQRRTILLNIAAGYAVRRDGETAEQLFCRADANMYKAKRDMKRDGPGVSPMRRTGG